MADKAQINIRVNPETKGRWTDAIEDNPEYDSLAHLIRSAVEHEIAGQTPDVTSVNAPSDWNQEQVGTLLDRSQEVIRRLSSMDKDIQAIRREVTTDEELTDLMGEVYSLLPEGEPEGSKNDRLAEVVGADTPPTATDLSRAHGKVGDMADALDTTEHRVEQAIAQLREDMPGMIRSAGDGRYYKEV
jgi:hypothetical protein